LVRVTHRTFATAFIDVLIPLIGGLVVLLIPVRRKSENESNEQLDARKKKMRLCGVGLIGVAGLYLLLKLARAN